jgi:hypothetical protein
MDNLGGRPRPTIIELIGEENQSCRHLFNPMERLLTIPIIF